MGNTLSNAEIDVEECANLALAVALSQQPEPVDPEGEAMAAAVAKAAGLYLRHCRACGEQSYLRQGVCLSPSCGESYLSLSAAEVGKRLQSWGGPTGDTKADAAQLEAKRLKRLREDEEYPQTWYKKSKGRKHREWTQSFREGRHPRTGENTTKPVWWKDSWMIWQSSTGWIRCDEHGNPTPEEEQPVANEPKVSGPPAPTEESKERYRQAQQMQQDRLREQAELMERHRAEANYGMATSARAFPGAAMGPQPVPPKPSAVKSSPPATAGDVVLLYRSATASQKSMAYEALVKMFGAGAGAGAGVAPSPAVPKGTFGMAPPPIKAMPAVPPGDVPHVNPEVAFMQQMATEVSSMLIQALGLGPLPSVPVPKSPAVVLLPKAKALALPAVLMPPPKAPGYFSSDTSEEEGDSWTRDPWGVNCSKLHLPCSSAPAKKKSVKLLCRRQHGNPFKAFDPTPV